MNNELVSSKNEPFLVQVRNMEPGSTILKGL